MNEFEISKVENEDDEPSLLELMEDLTVEDFDDYIYDDVVEGIDFEIDEDELAGYFDDEDVPEEVFKALFEEPAEELPCVTRELEFESFIEGLNVRKIVFEGKTVLMDTAFGYYEAENVGKNIILPSVTKIADASIEKTLRSEKLKEILSLPSELFKAYDDNAEPMEFEEIIERIPRPRILFNGVAYILHDAKIYTIENIGCQYTLLKVSRFKFAFDDLDNIMLAMLVELLPLE